MNRKVKWITETAVMLALLVTLQAVTRPLGQFFTGSCVNLLLAVTALLVGLSGGITIALISPVLAYLLGIAPNLITVIPIMAGNVCYVVLLSLLAGNARRISWRQPVALVSAATVKFLVLYTLVVKLICDWAAPSFLGKKVGDVVLLAPPMLQKLPAMFTWPQLVTALIGGILAFSILPVLRKALHK